MADEFFKLIFDASAESLECQAFCSGYENSEWRFEQLVEYIFDEYLLEFCLIHSEFESVNHKNARQKLREAFKNVYEYRERKKKQNGKDIQNSRGEFGELLLHAIMAEYHHTLPAISKIYYKDGPNEVVKGFDAVHVVMIDKDIELWLGEAKFYKDAKKAVLEALKSVQEHFDKNYLKSEFAAINRKIDNNWPHADKLKKLINPRTSLDEVFKRICVPVLITYNSVVVNKHNIYSQSYLDSINDEIKDYYEHFAKSMIKYKGIEVKIQLFFLPLKDKQKLVKIIDAAIAIGQK